ncbi:MAG: HAD-IC family P-type ATPase [bacterium]|nr:HAD-IC family P-type ATPase [bacterium]MDZ4296327.1 HAD-IC family P-type ATPase [Patescibacteria group bacterium]
MHTAWHATTLEEIFREVESSHEGLTSEAAAHRLGVFGRNALPAEKPYSKIRLFLRQFHNPLMYILFTTVAISFALKHYSDAIFIVAILLINTTVGFYQENKANQSLLALRKMVRIRARVRRDGHEKEIDGEELCVGDVVFLQAGDKVPADGRLIEAKGLKINEANLTGESQAVTKEAAVAIPEGVPLPERGNMAFMGTIVEEGRALMVVVAVGIHTQIGEIVSLLSERKERRTPLQRKIATLSKVIGAFVLSVIAVIAIAGYFAQQSFADIFVTALALAVSAIPAGILPAITVILVLGMRRIFRQKGLVRQLVATEALGSVTVICTDKTGTLTEGHMRVSHILTNTRELLGDGLNAVAKGAAANGAESHISALKIAMLANEAFVENPGAELEEWVVRGRPTEQALLLAGMQAGLEKQALEAQYPVLDRLSFRSDLKYAASLYQRRGLRGQTLAVIGAPEEIIGRCRDIDVDGKQKALTAAESEALGKKIDELTQKGLRVLACAHRDYRARARYTVLTELVEGLTFVGLIALKDPLRPDAREAIALTKRAGIRTVIITGDHKLTAKAIAGEIGLDVADEHILEGKDIERLNDGALRAHARQVSIYARVSPRHKLRIVDALQANGEIVAMLGDGVNDAPALKSADIGVAVGSGTDVAKEVADVVLLDDNFKTIVSAIEQGRVVFSNIRKVFVYLVADDFSELFIFFAAMIMGLPLPLLPAQILWINLVEDGFPDIALTTEQETKGVMEERPRDPKEPVLSRPIKQWMATILCITGLAAFGMFTMLWSITGDLEKTRAMVFVLMCVDSLIFAFSVRSFRYTIFRRDIFSNRYLVGGVLIGVFLLIAAVYAPPLQKLLATQPLGVGEWLLLLSVSVLEILGIEASKKLIFRTKSA